jgi:hypothetical protein
VGGIAGAIAAVLTLIFLLFPGLRPTGPPPERYSTVTLQGMEHNVNREGRLGVLLPYQLEMKGQEGEHNYVVWSVYNTNLGMRVPEQDLVNQVGATQEAEWNTDRGGTKLFIPYPRTPGQYYVQVEVYDDNGVNDGVILHSAKSENLNVYRL